MPDSYEQPFRRDSAGEVADLEATAMLMVVLLVAQSSGSKLCSHALTTTDSNPYVKFLNNLPTSSSSTYLSST